ncbi:MAG: hypothetical protein IPF83_03140 [Rhodanobacteraceae bacterium]|nr:hypothetical protein [Rhodanobacteraceae bacterium]
MALGDCGIWLRESDKGVTQRCIAQGVDMLAAEAGNAFLPGQQHALADFSEGWMLDHRLADLRANLGHGCCDSVNDFGLITHGKTECGGDESLQALAWVPGFTAP